MRASSRKSAACCTSPCRYPPTSWHRGGIDDLHTQKPPRPRCAARRRRPHRAVVHHPHRAGAERPDIMERSGWLGRYLDACQCGQNQLLPAVSVGDQLNSMFYAVTTLVPAVASIGAFSLQTESGDRNSRQLQIQTLRNIYNQAGNWPAHEAIMRQTALKALDGADQLRQATSAYHSQVEYPQNNALAAQLQMVAQIIAGNVGARLFSVQLSGFDTHAAQFDQQANLLGELG